MNSKNGDGLVHLNEPVEHNNGNRGTLLSQGKAEARNFPLKRRIAVFLGTDADRLFDIGDKDFAVADFTVWSPDCAIRGLIPSRSNIRNPFSYVWPRWKSKKSSRPTPVSFPVTGKPCLNYSILLISVRNSNSSLPAASSTLFYCQPVGIWYRDLSIFARVVELADTYA